MATESRAVDPDVDSVALEKRLYREPFVFEFFQAVRLLEKFTPARTPPGRFVNPADEVVRFRAHPATAFPASEIQALARTGDGRAQMSVNFMGLIGPLGLLPIYYTQLVMERIRVKDTALRDFLDIFNHRAISLFYQAWEKYRFTVEYERSGRDRFTHCLLDLVGLGTPALERRQAVPDEAVIYYAGLLAQKPRTAAALQQVLEDYFDVPVAIEQFAGAWFPLDRSSQCWLEERRRDAEQLGYGVVVGDEIWDEQSRVRIRLGPLTLKQYMDFLPTGTAYEPLRGLTRFFSDELDFEAQLILMREEVPKCELGAEGECAPQLGWVSWMRTAPLRADAGDTILKL